MWILFLFLVGASALPTEDGVDVDGESSRKILGSSVVTSVSVIMDTGNGSKAIFTDAVGKPVSKPNTGGDLASPINLLNPDRYEFYTFDDSGDLVKRLMTLDEIQGIVATGDSDGFNFDPLTAADYTPEKRVNDIVNNVQNVLKEEMEMHKDSIDGKPLFDTPDVSDSWSMILPAIFGNSGEDIKPERPNNHVTPDTIMLEPTSPLVRKPTTPRPFASTTVINNVVWTTPRSTTARPYTTARSTTANDQQQAFSKITPNIFSTTPGGSSSTKVHGYHPAISTVSPEKINVEIYSHSKSTTEKNHPLLELTKDNARPIYHVSNPSTVTQSTYSELPKIPSTYHPPIKTTTMTRLPSTTTTMRLPVSTIIRLPMTTSTTTTTRLPSPATTTTRLPSSTTTTTTTTRLPSSTTTRLPSTTTTMIRIPTTTTTTRLPSSTSTSTTPMRIAPTTQQPSTEILQNSLPTLAQILNLQTTTSTIPKISSTPKPPTTPALTTFTIVSSTKTSPIVTTNNAKDENITPTINQLLNKLQQDDLHTLATEYVTPKRNVTKATTESTLTTLPIIYYTTGGLPSKSQPSTQLLDQLLLTSTNIYEINTELGQNPTTIQDVFESTESTDESTTDNTEASTNVVINLGDQHPSTDKNLISSIEQLISQAVGEIGETVQNEKQNILVQSMLNNSGKKNMSDVVMETATVASQIVDREEVTTTEKNILNDIADTNLLSDSVGSLLSQIYGLDDPSLTTVDGSMTTVDGAMTTEVYTTNVFNRKTDNVVKFDLKTTEGPAMTTEMSAEIDKYQEMDLNEAVTKEPLMEDVFEPHIINITIISSEKKPAKVDLSQEEMYNQENMTIKNVTEPEILKAEASNSHTKPEESTTVMESTTDIETTTTVTTEAMETTTEVMTTPPPLPSVVVTINETGEKLRNITEEQEKETTTVISDDYTSSPPSTLRVTTTEELTESTSETETSEQNKPSWTLVPTIPPHSEQDNPKIDTTTNHPITSIVDPPAPVDLVPKPLQGFGLEDSTSQLDTDIYQFAQLCNELAFGFWKSVTSTISSARSVFVSPFAASSLLAMVFLGARGATSGEMNEILKLDDMVTFNPHLIFKNISESIKSSPETGVAVSAIVRELYSDRSKGPLLGFYKERAKQFYDGHVEEVSFKEIGDVIRRRTNLLVKKHSEGKIPEFLKDGSIVVRSPLAGVSVNVFQTDCSQASTEGRDGELHFVVLPSIRQRRLIPVPAVVYRSGFLAGYEPSLDATAVALGTKDQLISTILVIPGQQGIAAPGDGLSRLEKRLVESSFKKGAWSRLLRALIPRPGLEVQIPRFSHRSVINATSALKKMGLKDLFDPLKADLRGLNGIAHELHFSEMIQINNFATCGEDTIGDLHHSEIYPATPSTARSARYLDYNYHGDFLEEPRDYQRAFHDPLHDPSYLDLPLPLRPRQARLPDVPRLRFDRPFIYLVRHNPTGLILHMGRFNPRLLP